ncbi:hypothetical protein OIU76_015700 [Salix suchowensis]|nr:hypothetical protein OIU76_015700 [Salix suchowensis]
MSRISIPLVGFLLLLCCLGIPTIQAEGDYIKYRDPKQTTNVRIRDLMSRMTLAEKIGQMAQIERSVATADILRDCSIGSILSGGGSAPLFNAKAKDWIDMVNGFQNASLSSRLGIPMIYGIDAVHGHNNVYKATIFPHNVGLGATRDPDLVKRIGAATALEVRATGIPYVFAPCIAVCRDPRWGRCYESYSEDPKVVEMMTEIIPGLQGDVPSDSRKGVPYVGGKDKVAACAKHFVGDGGTTKGINENDTVIGYHGLMSIHMPAYFPSIIKGVSTVMVSYSSWNGQKMHANRYLVKTVLKDILKFRGFVISDWEGIDRITYPPHSNYTESVLKGISAGIDMIMVPYNHTEFINIVTDLLGSQAHRDLAREAILVAGSHANNLGYQCGGWTATWQGVDGNNFTAGTTILSGITAAVDPSTEIVYSKNPDADFVKSNNFSYAIVVVGETPYAETAGDSLNLTIAEPGPSTILNVCGNAKCVVVIVSGRPVVIEPYESQIDALVAAWLPGTEGQGVADVLLRGLWIYWKAASDLVQDR